MVKFFLYPFVLIFMGAFPISAPHATEKHTYIEKDLGSDLYPNIQKLSNDLYTAKIPGKELRLVMERVDSRTHPLWLQYIKVQSNPRASLLASNFEKKFNSDGSAHFMRVLTETSYVDNEIWVAYITKAKTAAVIPHNMLGYSADNLTVSTDTMMPFAKDIEMFVTVTSTPNALIFSPLGISSSIEGAISGRTKGTSLDLLSFVTKVMLMRNPKRIYMLNAPAPAMEKIILDALSGSVFVGTREMQKSMEASSKMTFDEFSTLNKEKIRKKLLEKDQKESDSLNRNLKRELESLKEGKRENKTEESLRQEIVERIPDDSMIEMGKNGEFVISPEKKDLRLPTRLQQEFDYFKNSEAYLGSRVKSTENFLNLWKQQPPILSVTNGDNGIESFAIFNPKKHSEVLLDIKKSNKDYQWMFTGPFRPAGDTHFIVVEIDALANSRKVG